MSKREKKVTRRNWRKNQRNKRERDRRTIQAVRETVTPPLSPEGGSPNENRRAVTMKNVGRKRLRRDRSKAYRTIGKLKVALFKQKQLVNKYKVRCFRLKEKSKHGMEKKVEDIIRKQETKKALLVFYSILERMKSRYMSTKGVYEKSMISSLICSSKILRKFRLGKYARRMFEFTRAHMTGEQYKRKIKTPRMKNLVVEFLQRDDNSRVKAGKKSTITRKGEKKQISLLNDNMTTLHKKFLAETHLKISYTLFCCFKPFNILKAGEKDRETCLCKTHENFQFKINRSFQEKIIKDKDIDGILGRITCATENKHCMYRECSECKDKSIPLETNIEYGKQTWWYEWKSRRTEKEKQKNGTIVSSTVSVTVKEKQFGSLQILSEELNKDAAKASRHVFNIRNQYKMIRQLRESLTNEEVMVQIDFSENYNCKYAAEIQSMPFGGSQQQISLHTGVAYTKDSVYSFCTASDCLKHGPGAIWTNLHPVLEELQTKTGATKIHFISDGPTTQYRNKQNFFLFSKRIFNYGFNEATWNLLEAGHGKGAADGIGAVVKRSADNFIHKGGDITKASDLINALMPSTTVRLYEVSEEDIEAMEATLPATLKPLAKTMQIHQVLVNRPGEVQHRVLSCFCQRPAFCECHDIVTTNFPMQPDAAETQSSAEDFNNGDAPSSSEDIVNGDAISKDPEMEPFSRSTSIPVPDEIPGISHSDTSSASATTPESDVMAPKLVKVDVVDGSIIHKYCVVKYDDQPYPGVIHDVDDDEEVEVQVMHRIGRNRFFWPLLEDILWYPKTNIITMLPTPPQLVTKRHHAIDPKIWALIEKELDTNVY